MVGNMTFENVNSLISVNGKTVQQFNVKKRKNSFDWFWKRK